jgi:hypothetical protein
MAENVQITFIDKITIAVPLDILKQIHLFSELKYITEFKVSFPSTGFNYIIDYLKTNSLPEPKELYHHIVKMADLLGVVSFLMVFKQRYEHEYIRNDKIYNIRHVINLKKIGANIQRINMHENAKKYYDTYINPTGQHTWRYWDNGKWVARESTKYKQYVQSVHADVCCGSWDKTLYNSCELVVLPHIIFKFADDTHKHIIKEILLKKIFLSEHIFINIGDENRNCWHHLSTMRGDDWDKITQFGLHELKVDSKYVIREYADIYELYKFV